MNASTYFVKTGKRKESGPYSGAQIVDMIRRRDLVFGSQLREEGQPKWTPIQQSPFAPQVIEQANIQRMVASTCPKCGAGMAVVLKPRGTFLLILGSLLVPVFGVGFIFLVPGLLLRLFAKAKALWRCATCNYQGKGAAA